MTPLQLATAYSTFANGGTVWQPVASGGHDAERGVRTFDPKVDPKVDMPPEFARPMLTGLAGCGRRPGHRRGRFLGFPLDRFPVAGKTGTAQVTGKQDTALFAAFAPADNPQYAIAVVMEESGFGGTSAVPVARRVFDQLAGVAPPISPRGTRRTRLDHVASVAIGGRGAPCRGAGPASPCGHIDWPPGDDRGAIAAFGVLMVFSATRHPADDPAGLGHNLLPAAPGAFVISASCVMVVRPPSTTGTPGLTPGCSTAA